MVQVAKFEQTVATVKEAHKARIEIATELSASRFAREEGTLEWPLGVLEFQVDRFRQVFGKPETFPHEWHDPLKLQLALPKLRHTADRMC